MIIKSLKLTNFRNHSSYELNCDSPTTLIIGPNGFGKTSILEAIYILLQGKSFRATDPAIIKRGTDFYRISLDYQSGETVIATYDGTSKTFQISDRKTHRLPRKNHYPIILFEPSDLNLIHNSPSSRRTYFDRLFSELNPSYASNLSRYKKALKQRNELLKNENITQKEIFSWDVLLANYGLSIFSARRTITSSISSLLTPVYHSIAQNSDQISLEYVSEVSAISKSAYLESLAASFSRDRLLKHTSFGIHHDDFLFHFNGNLADSSASRGESRTIILALKFIEASLVYDATSLRPLILLDDVFSELDESRRRSLVTNFKNHQIILTSVEKIEL